MFSLFSQCPAIEGSREPWQPFNIIWNSSSQYKNVMTSTLSVLCLALEYQGECRAPWPHASVSFTFLTLLTVKIDFEPVALWMVELFLLLNGRLSFLSPRKRRRHFSSSLLSLFLMAAGLKLSQHVKHQSCSWQKYAASKGWVGGSEMGNTHMWMPVLIMWVQIAVSNTDTSPSQRGGHRSNCSVLARCGSDDLI